MLMTGEPAITSAMVAPNKVVHSPDIFPRGGKWLYNYPPLMPTKLGYKMKLPVSSQAAFSLLAVSPDRSVNSLSTANRRPNSISSSFMLMTADDDDEELSAVAAAADVPACCSSCMAVNVSSYLRCNFPLRKLNIRTCLSERMDVVMKCDPVGENVRELGRDFV